MIYFYLQLLDTEEERAKFESLYLEYREPMFHIALRILNDHYLEEDAVHQAFLNIINHFDIFMTREKKQIFSYIFVTTEHAAIDMIRKRSKSAAEAIDPHADAYPFQLEPPSESDLLNALLTLPEHQRNILLLHYDYGFSMKELAGFFKINYRTVQKSIWRAKQALAKALEAGDQA